MFVFLISAIEWAKLITGLILMPIGLFLVIRPFYNWTMAYNITNRQAFSLLIECILGLIILIVAFFIAGW